MRRWIGGRTAASDMVVELHGRGGWVTRAAAEDLRRGLDLESTALTRLVAEIVLRPPDLRHLDAAFTALADAAARRAVAARVDRAGVRLALRQLRRPGRGRGVHLGRRRGRAVTALVSLRPLPGDRAPATRARCRSTRGHRRGHAGGRMPGARAGSSAASRCPTPTTSCPTSCWTCTRRARSTPSPASSSASRATCGRPASRPRCGWCSWACCCRPASSTASRAAWRSHASWRDGCGRSATASGASATRGCCWRTASGRCAASCSASRPAGRHLPGALRPGPGGAPRRLGERGRAPGLAAAAGGPGRSRRPRVAVASGSC